MLSRRDRLKLWTLGSMLLLVLVAMARVQDPHLWTWITPIENPQPQTSEAGEPGRPAEDFDETDLLATPPDDLSHLEADSGPESKLPLEPEMRDAGEVRVEQGSGRSRFNPLGLQRLEECRALDPELLERMSDLMEVRSEELPGIYQALAWAATTPPEEFARMVRRDVLLANLLQDRDAVRGSVVRVEGTLHRLIRHDGAERWNPFGIKTYYEAWIYSKEQMDLPAKHVFPTVVFLTGVPEGLEPGDSLKETVAVNGVFLKLMTYMAASDQRRIAPVLAAYELEWRRPPTISSLGIYWLLGIVAAVGLAIFLMASWSSREARKAEGMRLATRPEQNPIVDLQFLESPVDSSTSEKDTQMDAKSDSNEASS